MTSSKKTYNPEFIDNQELNENEPDYEKVELDLLRDGIGRSFQEKLLFTTMLYKVQQSFRKMTIVHKPYKHK